MATTNAYGLPVLEGADPLEYLDQHSAALAAALIRPVNVGFGAAAGWAVTAQNCLQILGNKILLVNMLLTYTGAQVNAAAAGAGAPGNYSDIQVATIPAAYTPPNRNAHLWGTFTGVRSQVFRWGIDGNLVLTHTYTSNILATNDTYEITGVVSML